MRRYASIDFLRGFAIWLMLLFHVIMRVYDYSFADNMEVLSKYTLVYMVVMVIIMFLGGWAGFFLLISAIGNTISVQKTLKRGGSVKGLFAKQITLGLLLLVVAFLTESITGYHGWLGEAVLGRPFNPDLIYRSFTVETIHTIAYSMIINAFITVLLSLKEGYKKEKRNMIINLGLAILVVGITVVIYNIPTTYGVYPEVTTLQNFGPIQQLNANPWGSSWGFQELVVKFFVFPLIGRPEPLLPFLATAFVGNIIGIWLAREKASLKELGIGMVASTVVTIVGLVGCVVYIILGIQANPIQLFRDAWNLPSLPAWLPMFIFTLGTQLVAVCLVLRLVEFRGNAQRFAKRRYW